MKKLKWKGEMKKKADRKRIIIIRKVEIKKGNGND